MGGGNILIINTLHGNIYNTNTSFPYYRGSYTREKRIICATISEKKIPTIPDLTHNKTASILR